jgi:predicted RNA polymerase sigma factor
MAQRISRAKNRLNEIGARFSVPPVKQLPDRVAAAAQVLYLIFTEGHTGTTGAALYSIELADEAIRLTRRLHACLPDSSEVAGLLALMLLTDARRAARLNTAGSLVPLAEQDRTLWDQVQIREGIRLVEGALPTGPVAPFQLQAAIAAVHAEAGRAEDTDWAQIEILYRMLAHLTPSAVITLNDAVAVAMVEVQPPDWRCSIRWRKTGRCAETTGCTPYALTFWRWGAGLRMPGRRTRSRLAWLRASPSSAI